MGRRRKEGTSKQSRKHIESHCSGSGCEIGAWPMVCYGEPGLSDPRAFGEPVSDKGYYVASSFVENKRVSLRRVLRGGWIGHE